MKKSLIIIFSLCALIAIGTLLIPFQTITKVENIPKQSKELVKHIEQEKVTTKKDLETLNMQKVSVQKQLAKGKVDLQKSKSRNQLLVLQVKELRIAVQQTPIADTTQTITQCFALAETIDSLLMSNQTQDSLFFMQSLWYDSILCVQQNQINVLDNSNTTLQSQMDTLLTLNKSLQQEVKVDKRKLVFAKIGNRVLATTVIACASIATYLQLKNRI